MPRDLPLTVSRQLVPPILRDEKLLTRRIINPQPPEGYSFAEWVRDPTLSARFENRRPPLGMWTKRCPFGDVGDSLWVREDYRLLDHHRPTRTVRVEYLADNRTREVRLTEAEHAKLLARRSPLSKPQPGRFLFKSCSRIRLDVTAIRVERRALVLRPHRYPFPVLPRGAQLSLSEVA